MSIYLVVEHCIQQSSTPVQLSSSCNGETTSFKKKAFQADILERAIIERTWAFSY